MARRVFRAAALALSLVGAQGAAQTEQERIDRALASFDETPLRIPRINEPVRIDGALDDAAWRHATRVQIAWQHRPVGGMPAEFPTTVLLMEDGKQLYVAFDAKDPRPDLIRASLRQRDQFFADDFVGFGLDTTGDGSRAYEFFSNALGVQGDAVMDQQSDEDFSWNAIFRTKGRITESGFEVEFAVPLSQIRFPRRAGEQQWKMFFSRSYTRDQRYQSFNYPVDQSNACFLCQFRPVVGFAGAAPGERLSIVPSITAARHKTEDPYGEDPNSDADNAEFGISDFRWTVTPDVFLNATINPDFSQIEADVAQLDVNTTYALFYPERRPFFLEGRDFFGTQLNLVNTRSVADPDYGVKVTGKLGANAFGVLHARDNDTSVISADSQGSSVEDLEQGNEVLIGRYRHDFRDSSFAGLLVTDRTGEDYHNRVISLDANYRVTESGSFMLQAVRSESDNPGVLVNSREHTKESGNAYHLEFRHRGANWNMNLNHRVIDTGFRADAGFINRTDVESTNIWTSRRWVRDPDATVRRVRAGFWAGRSNTLSTGELLAQRASPFLSMGLPFASRMELQFRNGTEIYDGEQFDTTTFEFEFSTRAFDGFSYAMEFGVGEQIDYANTRLGNGMGIWQEIEYAFLGHWLTRLRHVYRTLDVLDGSNLFTAHLTDLRLTYQFNLASALRIIVIRNHVERNPALYEDEVDARSTGIAVQMLYTYQLNPSTALYAGYSTSGIEADDLDGFHRTADTFFAKLSYGWRG